MRLKDFWEAECTQPAKELMDKMLSEFSNNKSSIMTDNIKAKAEELIRKFDGNINYCVIAVEEIIKAFEMDDKQHKDCHNLNSPTFRFYERVLNYLKSKQ